MLSTRLPALRCETLIKQGITVENVAMLYATAIKFSAEELEEFCFRFSLNHMVWHFNTSFLVNSTQIK